MIAVLKFCLIVLALLGLLIFGQATGDGNGVALLTIVVMIAAYFLPSIIAVRRNHHNATAILILNIAFGWTLFGWVAALIWAVMNPSRAVNNHA